MTPPVFVFQSVSKYGTANPIVARLALQSFEMLKSIDLTDKERETASKQLYDLHNRLLRCYDCIRNLHERNEETIEKTGQIFAARNRSIPFIIGLQDEVETFLTSAKQYLRDLVAPMNVIYRSNLKHDAAVFWDKAGKSSAAEKWAAANIGADVGLVKILRDDADWIGELIKRRNAMEHPGDRSGTLVIENYRFTGPTVAPPQWRRDVEGREGDRSPILQDLDTYLVNLLEFGEEIVAHGVKARPLHEHLELYQIPEERRDPKNPARFQVGLDAFLMERLRQADEASRET